MKLCAAFFLLIFSNFTPLAQTSAEILATADNQNFTWRDLARGIGETYEKLPQAIADLRRELLARQIGDALLAAEAAARQTTIEKLIDAEMRQRVSAPPEAQIQAVYDANRSVFGEKTLAQVRPQIVSFLRREPEQNALTNFVGDLKTKYKVVPGKDVNAPNLKPLEVLATANGKTITVQSFEEKAEQNLYEAQIDVYEEAVDALEEAIFMALVSAEAKSLKVQPVDVYADEITAKMKVFSEAERERLKTDLRNRLFRKYNAKIFMKAPAPFVQKIPTDGDPARGAANAPVTVVMFTDFQCPACAATHPALQEVLAEYAGNVRFVVRDFPLTTIHENAFQAAVAANAANAQGKFFEFVEVLYQNQSQLDPVSLVKYAADLKLNIKRFETDLADQKLADEVRKDMADGKRYHVNSTPTIFVNGVKVRQFSPEKFRRAIDKALKK